MSSKARLLFIYTRAGYMALWDGRTRKDVFNFPPDTDIHASFAQEVLANPEKFDEPETP